MMVVLSIAGAGLLLAGLLTVGFGIQMDLSFGNTLILSGTVVACTGIVMLSLWAVARELKRIAWRLGPGVSTETVPGTRAVLPRDQAMENGGFSFSRDLPALEDADDAEPAAQSSPPWRKEAAARDRGAAVPQPVEAAPAVKPRRNLLFSSSSRKERERAQGRMADPSAADLDSAPSSELSEAPPPLFDDAWPKSERSKVDLPPQRRGGRESSALAEANAGAAGTTAAPNQDQPQVTVLKSGVVDGMAYSLYSDGSIEAQMPEGMMRFASIDELRSHLDHRT
jgi:hypothetical protein